MAFFGLMTKREVQAQLDALKAQLTLPIHRWLGETADADRYNLPDPSVYGNQADLYRKVSWVLQAVDITASTAALARFDVKRVINDKEPKDIPNHPFEQLLRLPNPLDSRYEFLYATVAMYKLTGNGYWWLNRADENAPPDEMWLLPSHMIIPVPDEQMFIRGYLYYPGNGRGILLPPHEIVHFRRFNPFSRFVGLSPIEAIVNVAIGDISMQEWTTRLFRESNGRLPGVLTFEQMVADPTWNKIKADTVEATKNRNLLMLRGVGQGGVQWLQGAVTQKEMDFLNQRKMNKEEIFTTLAPGLYAWLSGESTYSNAGANRAAFAELTVYPVHVMMAEKITNSLLPAYGGRPLVGEFEDVRFTDKAEELAEQERYAITHTISEIREEYYGDDPLGDERDDLLPEQITAQSGGMQEPPPAPTPPVPPEGQPGPDAATETPPQPDVAPPQKAANKAEHDELARYERKALKNIGKPVEFTSDLLPFPTLRTIRAKLGTCADGAAVKAVFEQARGTLDGPEDVRDDAAIIKLADSLNNVAAAVKAQDANRSMIEVFKSMADGRSQSIIVPAPVINFPDREHSMNFVLPAQDAPQVYNNITHSIEPAKPADVHVDSPVNIYQTVERPETPVNNLNIENRIPEQPAPVTNLSIENRMPELPAPNTTIKNEFTMPELPALPPANITFAPNIEPTPINFNPTIEPAKVEVKTPKLKRSKDKVERDQDEKISGKTTDYEYEGDEE